MYLLVGLLALLICAIQSSECSLVSINYTRLYALDGRELLVEDDNKFRNWPGTFAVVRPPWAGIGGYGMSAGAKLFRDEFALVVADPERLQSSTIH